MLISEEWVVCQVLEGLFLDRNLNKDVGPVILYTASTDL